MDPRGPVQSTGVLLASQEAPDAPWPLLPPPFCQRCVSSASLLITSAGAAACTQLTTQVNYARSSAASLPLSASHLLCSPPPPLSASLAASRSSLTCSPEYRFWTACPVAAPLLECKKRDHPCKARGRQRFVQGAKKARGRTQSSPVTRREAEPCDCQLRLVQRAGRAGAGSLARRAPPLGRL